MEEYIGGNRVQGYIYELNGYLSITHKVPNNSNMTPSTPQKNPELGELLGSDPTLLYLAQHAVDHFHGQSPTYHGFSDTQGPSSGGQPVWTVRNMRKGK